MAKKISKRSRAARRGEFELTSEEKSLESVPKAEPDLKKHIIRTTIKNENLLAKKMENSKVRKNQNKKKTSSLKHKLERNEKLGGVLSGKIENSIKRAKYVQATRKAGWDQINKSIVVSVPKPEYVLNEGDVEKTQEQIEREEEDEYVRQFYEGDSDKPKSSPTSSSSANRFALLDEAEA
ncbi:Shuttling pre-60S factor ECM1 [Spathaspora sp. JA1]|nr:Shuttling pre-60S factor ECM1 [Spathaspora sp. JA1]